MTYNGVKVHILKLLLSPLHQIKRTNCMYRFDLSTKVLYLFEINILSHEKTPF